MAIQEFIMIFLNEITGKMGRIFLSVGKTWKNPCVQFSHLYRYRFLRPMCAKIGRTDVFLAEADSPWL
jgi:hypothetical protein